MERSRKIVLVASILLILTWAVVHLKGGAPGADPDWFVRLTLGTLMAFGLLAGHPRTNDHPGWFDRHRGALPLLALGAALVSVLGLVIPVRQFEWIGLVLLLYVSLRWSLPTRYRRNIVLALFLLYWIHPLPGQVFGPFQMTLQRLSIHGAEWLLQAFNHRVWADGFVLRAGLAEFGVPEECSGMRTAVTVLLCTLGVGMLLRLRVLEILAFLVLGVAQVLALNIVRISVFVHLATRSGWDISPTILHDTAGIFLIAALLLVQAEMVGWQRFSTRRRERIEGIRRGEYEPPKQSSFLPLFWYRLVRFSTWGFALLVLVAVLALAGYKRRPAHRAAMIRDVAEMLLPHYPRTAENGFRAALRLRPRDRDLLVLLAEAMLRGEQYAESLHVLDRVPEPWTAQEHALRSWGLAGQGRMTEAMTIMEALPEHYARLPGVAMLRAEYAARLDDPVAAGRFLRDASRSHLMVGRVRRLYPYLAAHNQWQVIADTHYAQPHPEPTAAWIAIQAHLSLNRLETAGRILREFIEQWPEDTRVWGGLVAFAARAPGSEWETLYENSLQANLEQLDAARLASAIEHGFQLRRPDLAWQAYRQLESTAPGDPALYLAAARHAPDWFVFRRRHVDQGASDAFETVDLRDRYRQQRDTPAFRPHWNRVPLAAEMVSGSVEALQDHYLRRGLEALKALEAAQALPLRFEHMYAVVLGMLGRPDDALLRLDHIAERFPEIRHVISLERAVNHERRAQWQLAYEALREHLQTVGAPGLRARLMYVNATLNMGMGLLAMHKAMETVDWFPEAPEAAMAAAFAWEAFGLKEQALFVLSKLPAAVRMPTFPQLLFDTGRYQEAKRLARVHGRRLREDSPAAPPRVLPAELTVIRRDPPPVAAAWFERAARNARRLADQADSPFLAALRRLEADWFDTGGRGDGAVTDPARWIAAGRDPFEQAAAGYTLSVHLARAGRVDDALVVARLALEHMPGSAILWRHGVALSGGEAALIAEGRQRFPADPDLWLAELVTRLRRADAGEPADRDAVRDWARQTVTEAARTRQMPPGDMVRAADFLLRRGLPEIAEIAVRHAIEHGRGLETAYVAGLRSAIAQGNIRWALSCALGGADHARNPKPFYQMLVNLSFAEGSLDRDLVVALEYLEEQFPDDPEWARQLGFVHFLQGDPALALSRLGPLIRRDDVREVQVGTLLLAAESARLSGRPDHAVSILEAALTAYPDVWAVHNNLVYTLAQNPETAGRALEMLPELLRMTDDAVEVLDTVALVYLRNGNLDLAERFIEKALASSDPSMHNHPYTLMNQAELLAARNEYDAAMRQLQEILLEPRYEKIVGDQVRQLRQRMGRDKVTLNVNAMRERIAAGETAAALEIINIILRDPFATDAQKREALAARRHLH